jgi:hypothetical protein
VSRFSTNHALNRAESNHQSVPSTPEISLKPANGIAIRGGKRRSPRRDRLNSIAAQSSASAVWMSAGRVRFGIVTITVDTPPHETEFQKPLFFGYKMLFRLPHGNAPMSGHQMMRVIESYSGTWLRSFEVAGTAVPPARISGCADARHGTRNKGVGFQLRCLDAGEYPRKNPSRPLAEVRIR